MLRSRKFSQAVKAFLFRSTVDSTFDMFRVSCEPNVANDCSSLRCEDCSFDIQVFDNAYRIAIHQNRADAVDSGLVADIVRRVCCDDQRRRGRPVSNVISVSIALESEI